MLLASGTFHITPPLLTAYSKHHTPVKRPTSNRGLLISPESELLMVVFLKVKFYVTTSIGWWLDRVRHLCVGKTTAGQ